MSLTGSLAYLYCARPIEEAQKRQPSYEYIEEMKQLWHTSKDTDATTFLPYESYITSVLKCTDLVNRSNPGFMMLTGETFEDFFNRHDKLDQQWMLQRITMSIDECNTVIWR